MNKTIFTLTLCLTLIAPVWGEEKVRNGYFWEKNMSEMDKLIYMAGFMNGHNSGFLKGLSSGYLAGRLPEVKRNKEKLIYPLYRKGDGTDNEYYTKEVDAFLQTYPFCKKLKLDFIMDKLIAVWIKLPFTMKELTYKEIGEDCSK